MFILDSLMISGLKWVMNTVATVAEAEMNDDTALREQLMAAELQRELGEISDKEFADVEADLLARIREIKERKGGSGPIALGAQPIETTGDSRFQVEATVSGDFHEPADRPHTHVIDTRPTHVDEIRVGVDLPMIHPGVPAPATPGTTRTKRTARTARTTRTGRTVRTARTTRTTRTTRKSGSRRKP
jgi:hypothetical protein